MTPVPARTLLVTGGSRGIGLAIAKRAAREGANVAILGKTVQPHPKLPGTIHTAAREIEEAGGRALAIQADVRFDDQVQVAVDRTVERFGGIDVLVNNASAIFLAGTEETPMKRFDLMHQVNVRATFLCSRLCIPHLRRGRNPHILTLAPPLDVAPGWFGAHLAYTMAKYGMSLCTLGLAEELRGDGIAVNALWPRTTIATAAVRNLLGGEEMMRASRTPEIVADAAWEILGQDHRDATGRFFVDEDVLREAGVTDFAGYRVDPEAELPDDLLLGPAPP